MILGKSSVTPKFNLFDDFECKSYQIGTKLGENRVKIDLNRNKSAIGLI